jgi:RNA polymerase sporulation-specific sigma factor
MYQYNDYELLYLMDEFDEVAEKIFYEKYTNLIKNRIYKFKIKDRYKEDFLQEGLYMLFIAIRTYNDNYGKSFNKYFDLILKRKFIQIISREKNYFYQVDLKNDVDYLSENEEFIYEDNSSFTIMEQKDYGYLKKNYRQKDISKVLECDIKSVYNCICRIKTKLKK